MSAAKKAKAPPKKIPMVPINVKIPLDWHDWLERRAERVPGLKLSDVVRMIFKAEMDREEVRDGRK